MAVSLRTPKHEAPEPLEGPIVPTIMGGTILWFVLFLVQLPFYGWFDDHGHAWWVWTCLAGGGLGLDRHLVRPPAGGRDQEVGRRGRAGHRRAVTGGAWTRRP